MQGRPLSLQMGPGKLGELFSLSFVALPIPELIESGTTVEAMSSA